MSLSHAGGPGQRLRAMAHWPARGPGRSGRTTGAGSRRSWSGGLARGWCPPRWATPRRWF